MSKELLASAAKSGGYEVTWKEGACKGGPFESAFIGDQPWNPLTDDGDAFRLAAKLGFDLKFGKSNQASLYKDGDWYGTATGPRNENSAGSMRRAIVRLAAKQQDMPEDFIDAPRFDVATRDASSAQPAQED